MRRVWCLSRVLLTATGLAGAVLPAMAQEQVREQIGPFADIDWSLGLRGSYAGSSSTGATYEMNVAPDISWSRNGEAGRTSLGAGSDIAIGTDGDVHVDDLHATGAGELRLNESVTLSGNSRVQYGRMRATDTSLPANTVLGPTELTGTLDGSAALQMGHVDVTGRLGGTRYLEGETTLSGGGTVDNSENSYWQGRAGLRLGYDIGPLLSAFIDGEARYTGYDAPSTTLGVLENGRTYTLSTGLAYRRNDVLNAEISVGRSLYDYEDAGLADQQSWVANGNLRLQPDETLTLTGALDSSLGASTLSAGDTDLGVTASSGLRYVVNPWLTWRLSGSYDRTWALASGLGTWGYSFGAGMDVATTRFADWTADYSFAHDVATSGSATDTHRVSVGMTLHR